MAVPAQRLYVGRERHLPLLLLSGLLVVAASFLFLLKGGMLADKALHHGASQWILALWVLLPAAWFYFEYFYYFPRHGNPDAGFDALRGAQTAAVRLWIAIVVLLGALYLQQFSAGT